TPDRVRETLFNWLGQDLTGKVTLDPFAGSGALSLEALSRGAALAVAVDKDPQLVRALATTAAKLGTQALETHCADARAFLAQGRLSRNVRPVHSRTRGRGAACVRALRRDHRRRCREREQGPAVYRRRAPRDGARNLCELSQCARHGLLGIAHGIRAFRRCRR